MVGQRCLIRVGKRLVSRCNVSKQIVQRVGGSSRDRQGCFIMETKKKIRFKHIGHVFFF